MLYEYFGNIHMHTTYSDGTGDFAELIDGAVTAGLDFVYVTDHNVLVREEEGYRRGVLTLVGQEVHDVERTPGRSHLLCLGVHDDLTGCAGRPQQLIDAVNAQGALAFLAHPVEEWTPLAPFHYSWEDWDVTGYAGIELWNYMSGFRGLLTSRLKTVMVGFFPHLFTVGPVSGMLEKWDELTRDRAVVAIGGTDVHAWRIRRGLLRRRFLSYHHCARALNTHILTDESLQTRQEGTADRDAVQQDHRLVLAALRAGHCWIGYDLAGSTAGFRFQAWQRSTGYEPAPDEAPDAIMGDTLAAPDQGACTRFQVSSPAPGRIRLIRNGTPVAEHYGQQLNFETDAAGVYRVEVFRRRWGNWRSWIFSNPIYVR